MNSRNRPSPNSTPRIKNRWGRAVVFLCLLWPAATGATVSIRADEPVFSGPQVDEPLLPFRVQFAWGDQQGKELDPIGVAAGQPVLLLFVHEVTRPSVALTRSMANYAHRFHKEGLQTTVIFLTANPTEATNFVKRASHALPTDVALTLSPDGQEGPGAYGLNRKMTLTVLVGKQNKVTANFALIQPSLAVDAPRIGRAIQEVLGHDHQPSLEELAVGDPAMRGNAGGRGPENAVDDATFRSYLAPVINRSATTEQVDEAAARVEAYAKQNPAFATRVGQTARRIIDAGRLTNYGTPPAQAYLRKWAKVYRSSDEPPPASAAATDSESSSAAAESSSGDSQQNEER
jgi:hypothetical protein